MTQPLAVVDAASPTGHARQAVLVVGIYLIDKENSAARVTAELGRSREWAVTQAWVGLGRGPIPDELAGVTASTAEAFVPKFVLLNDILSRMRLDQYAFVVVCDDDIEIPSGFLDRYLERVVRHDLALAQPARTHASYIDHAFVEQLEGLGARWTRFVEIGPLFSVRRDAVPLLLPFDEASPMGWGYDLAWPCVMERAGLKMGIIDATPVDHSLRKPVAYYEHQTATATMERFLEGRPHLSKGDAWLIIESYV